MAIRDVSRSKSHVSMSIRDVSLSKSHVSISIRDVSMSLRDVSMAMRDVSLGNGTFLFKNACKQDGTAEAQRTPRRAENLSAKLRVLGASAVSFKKMRIRQPSRDRRRLCGRVEAKRKEANAMSQREKLIKKAETQAKGMTDLGHPVTAGAPFGASEVTKQADAVDQLGKEQAAVKAAGHVLTEKVKVEEKKLRQMVGRNVSFFQGKLGRTDPRIAQVGGKVYAHHGKKLGPRNAGTSTTTPPPSP
jgi:hypothetical protein